MKQQESTKTITVSGLCAGQSVKEIMKFANIKKGGVGDRGQASQLA
jgi:hypothetical protein